MTEKKNSDHVSRTGFLLIENPGSC